MQPVRLKTYILTAFFLTFAVISCKKKEHKIEEAEEVVNPIPKLHAYTTQIDVYVGEVLEISGENLTADTVGLTVKFNGRDAKIISVSPDKILVEVPRLSEESISTIKVKLQNQWTTIGDCQLGPTTITQNPVSLKYGDTLTVYGRNLHLLQHNSFTLDGFLAFPTEITPQYIKRVLTYFPAKHRKTIYNFKYENKHYAYQDITITDKWYWASYLPFVSNNPNNVFTLNNEVYVLSPTENTSNVPNYLFKFNPETYAWTRVDIPKNVVAATGTNNKIFLATKNKELFELKNGITTYISALPDKSLGRQIFMKSDNGKIYLLLGIGGFINADMFFYIYNEDTKIWQEKSIPVMNFGPGSVCFIVNHTFYIFDYNNRMWKYDETNDTWIQKATCPYNNRNWRTGFVYKNKIYSALIGINDSKEQIFVYDPANDMWYNQGPTTNRPRGSTVGFAINGQFYFGGSISEPINKYYSDLIQTEAFDVTGSSESF